MDLVTFLCGNCVAFAKADTLPPPQSIAIAFFFAARGLGSIENPIANCAPLPYHSRARVLLSGLGADELLGGYARHRRAFNKLPEGDWTSLINELQTADEESRPGRSDHLLSRQGGEISFPGGQCGGFLCENADVDEDGSEIWRGGGGQDAAEAAGEAAGAARCVGCEEAGDPFWWVASRLRSARTLTRCCAGARTAKMEPGSGKDKGETSLD
jgi:hypothetical protein